MFNKRKLIIATKHKKESVIAPKLEKALGVSCFIDADFDTDTFGTFSGEIERKKDPISTAREKCLSAMKKNKCDLGIASEGSFGPHPSLFFVNADDECIIFIDQTNAIEITARAIDTSTNFDTKTITNEQELVDFAQQIGFPEHGLILRKHQQDKKLIYKGIEDMNQLKLIFNQLMKESSSVYVETDMRAMYNPTRMEVIAKATKHLIEKIKSTCPDCQWPGFDISEVRKGLLCGLCGMPTASTLSFIYTCKQCGYQKENLYPHQKTKEDPTYCDYCNP